MQLKSIIAVLFLSVSAANVNAQQIFRMSQYQQHNFLYNPAAAGAADQASVGASYRKMWAGIDGGPQTTILFGDKYFAKKKVGIAVALYDDKTGPTSRTGGQINLSYSIPLKEGRRLMFGLGGQILQQKLDKAAFAESDYFDDTDPIMSAPANVTKGDASAGIYYKTPTVNFGFSVQQLIQSKLDFIKGTTNTQGKQYRHYNFTADYYARTDEDNVLIPNVLVRYLPNAPVDIEGGVRLEHKNILWVGFNYHYKQSYAAFAGVKIQNKLAIGYAYDVYKTPLSVFDDGGDAHEISLRYFFK
ncbi:PorP/SprF family type IX secretion system membrane protein [Ferruginibacter sp. SUN002]|uniref:PorP/SprF family type IX secretion system membrane protein n=1 Tax=Ferruginibacter sp. SUN002 TaxID=2937789 RepID=UPI003D36FE79